MGSVGSRHARDEHLSFSCLLLGSIVIIGALLFLPMGPRSDQWRSIWGRSPLEAERPRCTERTQNRRTILMDLATWLPGMFIFGLAAMGLCYAFLIACE